jgi:hypothetical protein
MTTPSNPVSVCAYVNLSFEDVLAVLSAKGERLLHQSAEPGAGGRAVAVRVAGPTVVWSRRSATVPLSWRSTVEDDEIGSGGAELTALVVSSGANPMTELLVRAWSTDGDFDQRREAASEARRYLDSFVHQVEQAVASPSPAAAGRA